MQRFLSVDPLAEMYYGWSPYNYVTGNPILMIDPTGMSAEICETCDQNNPDHKKYIDSKDNYTYHKEDGIVTGGKGDAAVIIGSKRGSYAADVNNELPFPDTGEKSIFRNKAIEISGGAALGGGYGVAIGVVIDDEGNSAPYITGSAKLGFGAGFGISVNHVLATTPKGFRLDMWEGNGAAYNVGLGPVGYSWGGNLRPDQKGPEQFVDYGVDYRTNSVGLPLGSDNLKIRPFRMKFAAEVTFDFTRTSFLNK